jgi:FixJ family two-component response regulator/GAF domain-containing protein
MTTAPQVLVVDDERFFREAVRDALADLDVRCRLAETGEEGLKHAEDPDTLAVVLDVRLPGMSGIEVLRALREQRPSLRVIVLSAVADQDMVLEALRLGASDYLAKPIHAEELRLAVLRALEATRETERLASLRSRLDALAETNARLARWAGEGQAADRLEALADPAVAALAEVLGAARTSLLVAEGDGLRVAAMLGSDVSPSDLPPIGLADSVAGVAFGADRVLRIDDIDRDERCAGRSRRGRYATGAALLAPLAAGGRAGGVLCAADPASHRPFTDEDVALLRLFAAQLGSLLAESEEVSPHAAAGLDPEDALHADLLRAICEAVTSEVEPPAVFRAALGPIAEALSAIAAVYTIDARSGELVLEAGREWNGRADRERLPGDGGGLSALALRSGRVVAAERPADEVGYAAGIDTPADGAPGPLLLLPLAVRGKVLGLARIHPESAASVSAATGEVLGAALSAALRSVLLYRSLLDAVDDVAAARRRMGNARTG